MSVWKDTKKFAKKHPYVAWAVGTLAVIQAVQIYFGAYVATKAFEKEYQ